MATADVKLVELGDGGDVVLNNNDLELVTGFQNMPYIALFGGNLKQSTTGPKTNEQIFDYWGNFLFHPTTQPVWFNSKTERLLNEVAITSAGRIQIEQQVKKDLEFMNAFANVTVSVSLVTVDRIKIYIEIIEPNVEQPTSYGYIWDTMEQELTEL